MIKGIAASGMAICFLAACGAKQPDCGSNATISTLKEFFKKYPDNVLFEWGFYEQHKRKNPGNLLEDRAYKDEESNAAASASWKVELIRTLSKNPETQAVSCVAKVSVTAPGWDDWAERQVNYTAQYTTEGQLYVEVKWRGS